MLGNKQRSKNYSHREYLEYSVRGVLSLKRRNCRQSIRLTFLNWRVAFKVRSNVISNVSKKRSIKIIGSYKNRFLGHFYGSNSLLHLSANRSYFLDPSFDHLRFNIEHKLTFSNYTKSDNRNSKQQERNLHENLSNKLYSALPIYAQEVT